MSSPIVDLIVGIAWPCAAVWIAHIFRQEIRALFQRVSKLTYKGLEAQFDKDLKVVEATVRDLHRVTAEPISLRPEIETAVDRLMALADVSPRAAIMEAWVLIERAAAHAGFAQGAGTPRLNPSLLVHTLVHDNHLPAESGELVQKLRELRNQATHLPDFSLTKSEAQRYLELAGTVSELIERLGHERTWPVNEPEKP